MARPRSRLADEDRQLELIARRPTLQEPRSRSRARRLSADSFSRLVAEEKLAGAARLIEELATRGAGLGFGGLDDASRQAYGRYLLFASEEARRCCGLSSLSRQEVFYNTYYWILVFLTRYQLAHGDDAGIEQMAFRLLASAPARVDWDFVVEIMQAARRA